VRRAWILAGAGFAVMAVALAYGFGRGEFRREGGELLRLAWGQVALVDVYVGFALFGGWVAFRERSAARAAVWIVLVLGLGNLVSCFYVLIALKRSRGDWNVFWRGARTA
jgi:uncharacterized membrane protein